MFDIVGETIVIIRAEGALSGKMIIFIAMLRRWRDLPTGKNLLVAVSLVAVAVPNV
jgi:hypothetical protein